MNDNIAIQLFEGNQIRIVWDAEAEKYWFSIVDVVQVLTESVDGRKYWNKLKQRLVEEGNETVTNCHQLKLPDADGKKRASDGKHYATDCFAQEDIEAVVKTLPAKNTTDFLDWFTYSDNTIDGQSKKKAYTLWESNLLLLRTA